jgi:hypothetical protein
VVKLLAYARHELLDRRPPPAPTGGALPGSNAAPDVFLLLEGSWRCGVRGATGGLPAGAAVPGATGGLPAGAAVRQSLDETIDARFDWIDQQAADFAELLGGLGRPLEKISPACLNALALRYYLVKLIRPLAYLCDVQPLGPGDHLELVAASGRDEDYAEVLSQYCRAAEVHYRVRWVDGSPGPAADFPANGRWRRCIARLAGFFQRLPDARGPGRRVVLCGNPRLLDPVCRELAGRGCDLWWLHDRFAVRSWLRWQPAGVGQLACNSSLAQHNRLSVDVPDRLDCRGVNLAGPVRRWLTTRVATHGPRQTRLIEQIDSHFGRVRPDVLVLDEDATSLARAAVAVGRRYGAASFVVQHGVPYCRFGFAPLVADRILVWGRSSRQRLIDWGVPPRRIRLTGSPQHAPTACGNVGPLRLASGLARRVRDGVLRRIQRRVAGVERSEPPGNEALGRRYVPPPATPIFGFPPRILLLATVPPRDDRPDAVALHLTSRTYAQMLRTAFAAVAEIDGAELDGAELDGAELDGVELIVKLHPRNGDDPVVRALRAEFHTVDSRLVRRGRLEKWLAGVSCVLSCGSSAGVEATLAGMPVIQLAPPGASGFLPHDRWGLVGTARSQPELRELLARLAADGWRAPLGPDPGVFASFDRPAAARVAGEVLAPLVESEVATADSRHSARGGAARQALPAGYCEPVNESAHR